MMTTPFPQMDQPERSAEVIPFRQPLPARFDYTALNHDVEAAARATAERIRQRLKTAYVETGKDLIAIKDRLGPGRFWKWLAAEFDMTHRSAERYMEAARLVMSAPDNLSGLAPRTIYALACAPEAVRISLIERIANGEAIRARDVRADVREAAARRKIEDINAERRSIERERRKCRASVGRREEHRQHERERLCAEADRAGEELVQLLRDRLGPDLGRFIGLLDTINRGPTLWSLHSLAKKLRGQGAA